MYFLGTVLTGVRFVIKVQFDNRVEVSRVCEELLIITFSLLWHEVHAHVGLKYVFSIMCSGAAIPIRLALTTETSTL